MVCCIACCIIGAMTLWHSKIRAFTLHLVISLALAVAAAALVFGLWYPYPYREISGGRELFLLIVAVDVVAGPLITLAVFNPAKSRREKLLDFSVIGLLQLGALAYGLWTVAQARPVHTVFEYDRFRVVHAVDVPPELLSRAIPELQRLPWTGPTYLALRPLDSHERMEFAVTEMQGLPLSARPELWRPYEFGHDAILKAARPVKDLLSRFPQDRSRIERVLSAANKSVDEASYLPLSARKDTFWTLIIDSHDAKVVGYLPIDSF